MTCLCPEAVICPRGIKPITSIDLRENRDADVGWQMKSWRNSPTALRF
jgi:hypothetical protein